MTALILGKLLPLVLKFLVAPVVHFIGAQLLNLRKSIDNLPAIAKRLVIAGLAFAFAVMAHVTGSQLPGACAPLGAGQISDECWTGLMSPEFLSVSVTAALGWLGAELLQRAKKADPRSGPKPAK
jgi:hypothetical protein